MPTYIHTPRDIPRTAHLYRDVYDRPSYRKFNFSVAGRFDGFWAYGEQSYPNMGDSLPRMPMDHRDAASFILAGEIRNRTNTK